MSATLVRDKRVTSQQSLDLNEFDLDVRVIAVPNNGEAIKMSGFSEMNSCYQTCYGNGSCPGGVCTFNGCTANSCTCT